LYPGDFFGEMALIHNAPRAATVKTVTPTTVLEIRKNAFEYILRKNPTVSLAMVREVSSRLRENDEMAIEDLRVKAGELAAAYDELADQEYTRKEFLTTIAHELRTPLTTANGFLQVIRMGLLQGEALKSALDTVSENIQKIIAQVNDILFLYEMDLILQDFKLTDIGAVVATAVEQQRMKAERSQVGLDLKIAPDIPLVNADAKGLERVVAALLDNAIKFSPDGGDVHVEAGCEGVNVWVQVRDQGVGIPADMLPRLFKRFFRMDEVNGHLFSGAGLGLSIARQVVEQHGGRIDVESELGKGSTFTLRLKARSSSE
jgi:two-component system sensor histidine kinase VicK